MRTPSPHRLRKNLTRALMFVIAAVFAIIFLLPTILTISNSFMTATEITANYGKIFQNVSGGSKKFISETTLLGQNFVKDPDQTVEKLLKAAGATVTRFVRYEVGEGIDKKEDNFVEEVMAQARSATQR